MSYFKGSVTSHIREIHQYTSDNWTETRRLVFAAMMSIIAVMLQSAGGFILGIGFLISPFSTLSILLVTVISLRHGSFAYLLAICLLLLIEPSELFIFPFTTGLLGLGLGFGLRILNQRIGIILLNGILLFTGICIPFYIFEFPVFGPISASLSMNVLLSIAGFSILYSWLWLEFGLFVLRRLSNIILLSK